MEVSVDVLALVYQEDPPKVCESVSNRSGRYFTTLSALFGWSHLFLLLGLSTCMSDGLLLTLFPLSLLTA